MAKPGRRTNLNQIKSLEPKFAPNISETNFGKKYPNKAPEATARPSKKANTKRRELFSDLSGKKEIYAADSLMTYARPQTSFGKITFNPSWNNFI